MTPRPIRRLLVANRGEIAVRVMRAASELGIETVAVFSDADHGAPHTVAADIAVRIGPEPAAQSYLDIQRVLDAARRSGADAVHPGYGFLSENPGFADAVADAGLVFVGPSASAMRALGNKASAKQVAAQADVPTVPEWAPDAIPADAFPVLVKAAAGGGGRGMRVVRSAAELDDALESARREAASGFGDDQLLVEKLVEGARHVEVQLIADGHGNCLYIGDRDCSLQRRHQKVIEEAPAPNLPDELHRDLGEAAVRLAQAVGYTNAGTAEFLVAGDGSFFFLELNARLQVEHPVTELAFGVDLVQLQLQVAQGEALTLAQHDVVPRAHSMEARVYAEDPVTFLPTGGRLLDVRLPAQRPGVRVDHAVAAGRSVSLAYDPLLAKVIATASTREASRQLLLDALEELALPGVVTNVPLLQHALQLDVFRRASHTIETLGEEPLDPDQLGLPDEVLRAARRSQFAPRWQHDPFAAGKSSPDPTLLVTPAGDELWVTSRGRSWTIPRSTVRRASAGAGDASQTAAAQGELVAPMPGTVLRMAEVGSRVDAGDPVVVLEAMKMETALTAPFAGEVREVCCTEGDLVSRGATLATIVAVRDAQSVSDAETAGSPR